MFRGMTSIESHNDHLGLFSTGPAPLAFIVERVGEAVSEVLGQVVDQRVSGVVVHESGGGRIDPLTIAAVMLSSAGSVRSSGLAALRDGAAVLVVPAGSKAEELAELAAAGAIVLRRGPSTDLIQLVDGCRAAVADWTRDQLAEHGHARGDLSAFIEGVAALLGGPVILEDANLNVIAYSAHAGPYDHGRDSAILGGRTPDEWVEFLESDGMLDHLRSSGTALDVSGGPRNARRRLVVGMRDQHGFLGLLWLAEDQVELGDRERAMLERVAVPAALQVRDFHAQVRARASAHSSTVRRLLEGQLVSRSLIEAAGLRASGRYELIGVRPLDDVENATAADPIRLLDAVEIYCRAYRWDAATCLVGQTCFVIVGSDDAAADGPSPALKLARGLADNCRRAIGREVVVVVTEPTASRGGLPALTGQAEACIELGLRDRRLPRTLMFGEWSERLAVHRVAERLATEDALPARGLIALDELDAGSEGLYRRTLVVYLRHLGNVSRAASELGIHATTLRYRLHRLQEATGIDLDDVTTRLFYSLALWPDVVGESEAPER
jgi:hypothetical protein